MYLVFVSTANSPLPDTVLYTITTVGTCTELQLYSPHQQSFAPESLLEPQTIPQASEVPCGLGHWETHRDGMTPGSMSQHDHESSRPNSGRSSTASGRSHAEILAGSADAHSSSGHHHEGAASSGDSYM